MISMDVLRPRANHGVRIGANLDRLSSRLQIAECCMSAKDLGHVLSGLAAAFFVGVEGFAKAVEQVAAFYFSTFGLMRVRPKQHVGLRIEQRNSGVTLRDSTFIGSPAGRGELAFRYCANVVSALE